MGRPFWDWSSCLPRWNGTLFPFPFHGRLAHSIYLPFFCLHKSNRCIQRKAGPVCQPSRPRQGRRGAGRRRSHSHSSAEVIIVTLSFSYSFSLSIWAIIEMLGNVALFIMSLTSAASCFPFQTKINQSINSLFLLRRWNENLHSYITDVAKKEAFCWK